MPLPHRLHVVTPAETTDEYDNPVPARNYGPPAARRTIRGLVKSGGSREPTEPGRQPVVTTWSLFTFSPITARERSGGAAACSRSTGSLRSGHCGSATPARVHASP